MAHTIAAHPDHNTSLLAPFRAIGRFLVSLAEASKIAQEIDALNAMSDDELARRGTTRQAAALKLFDGFSSC